MKQVEKYKGLLDMINGGGANAEGDKFQGGGLLSILANALATPYGSEGRAEEAAGLLGNTRPQMRPNRPASIAPAAISAGSAPAPSYTMPGTIAEMSDRARDRAMPLTQVSDIPGGFNPANVAPVQVQSSGMTPANNYVPSDMPTGQSPVEMFGGQQPAPYESSPKMQAERFVADLNAQYPNQAQAILTSTMAQGIFDDYIRNGYQLPAL
jgi:hypothetical protein